MNQSVPDATDHPWDKAAQGWNRHSTLVNDWLRGITDAMLTAAGIAEGARVLDVAAGAGGQTLDIARRVGSHGAVLATDVSPRILELAAANARTAGLTQVTTRVADAQALGLAGSGFDAAVSRLGLMFCPQPQLAFKSIAGALRLGGRFAAAVFSQPQANPCIAILMATARRHAGLAPARHSSPARCAAWANRAWPQSFCPKQALSTCGSSRWPRPCSCRRPGITLTLCALPARPSCKSWRRCQRPRATVRGQTCRRSSTALPTHPAGTDPTNCCCAADGWPANAIECIAGCACKHWARGTFIS